MIQLKAILFFSRNPAVMKRAKFRNKEKRIEKKIHTLITKSFGVKFVTPKLLKIRVFLVFTLKTV